MELVSLKSLSKQSKIQLLSALDLGVDKNGFVVGLDGKQILDKYIEKPVLVENMVIFPGSTIVLDDNPLSIASYIEEFGEVL